MRSPGSRGVQPASSSSADRVSASVRSSIMRRVRGANNRSTERRFVAALVRRGVRGWQRSGITLPGRPDLVFPDRKIAVFLDGCFWHRCPRCARPMPVSRASYWQAKIDRNVERDRQATRALRKLGWNVVRLWEHQLTSDLASAVNRLLRALETDARACES
jgi:DNA mismatch endonuclease, patch repair protein